jgi:hypothetical protein
LQWRSAFRSPRWSGPCNGRRPRTGRANGVGPLENPH